MEEMLNIYQDALGTFLSNTVGWTFLVFGILVFASIIRLWLKS